MIWYRLINSQTSGKYIGKYYKIMNKSKPPKLVVRVHWKIMYCQITALVTVWKKEESIEILMVQASI